MKAERKIYTVEEICKEGLRIMKQKERACLVFPAN